MLPEEHDRVDQIANDLTEDNVTDEALLLATILLVLNDMSKTLERLRP